MDRLGENKTKRGRRATYNTNENVRFNSSETDQQTMCDQDSSITDGHVTKLFKPVIARSYSENNLSGKHGSSVKHLRVSIFEI